MKHLDKALIASGAALLLSGGIAAAALGPSNIGSAVMASLPERPVRPAVEVSRRARGRRGLVRYGRSDHHPAGGRTRTLPFEASANLARSILKFASSATGRTGWPIISA